MGKEELTVPRFTESSIHPSVVLRDHCVVREGATIGPRTRLGIGVYLGPGTQIGADCKIQNGAQIFEPAVLRDGCFVGPAAILTNDRNPRAITAEGLQKTEKDWVKKGVCLEKGVSIGAAAVCVGPLTLGEWALVAAGSVVTKSFPPFSLVAGSPAKRIGWVGKAGYRLFRTENGWKCPETGQLYAESMGKLVEVAQAGPSKEGAVLDYGM